MTLQEAKALLKEDDDLIIAVYDYWLNKRLRNASSVRTVSHLSMSVFLLLTSKGPFKNQIINGGLIKGMLTNWGGPSERPILTINRVCSK